MVSDEISCPHYESMLPGCVCKPSWVLTDSVTFSLLDSFQLGCRWLTDPVVSFPSLPPRLELVVLLVGAAAGYNLTMQILPREQIDLAQLEADEQFSATAESQKPAPTIGDATPSVLIGPDTLRSFSVCAVPAGGGPAVNERFEPC